MAYDGDPNVGDISFQTFTGTGAQLRYAGAKRCRRRSHYGCYW